MNNSRTDCWAGSSVQKVRDTHQQSLLPQLAGPAGIDLLHQAGSIGVRLRGGIATFKADEDGVGVSVDDLVTALLHKCVGESD